MSDSLRIRLAVLLLLVAGWQAVSGGGGLPFAPSGPRTLVLLHEAQDQTPAVAKLTIDMQAGEAAKYAKEKGHRLLSLDDDNPDPQVRQLVEALGDTKPPAVLVLAGGRVIHKQPLPSNATGSDIIAILKANGG
jgi:hypothetical protein